MSENIEYTPEAMERLLARVNELVKPVESVRLYPRCGETTVFDSKMGGVPYFLKSMEYPVVREGEHKGKPLFFLAQLNFKTLPKLPGFPTEGILQFFTGCEGDEMVYGMNDYDDLFNQNAFRVIFHENIITDESMLYSADDMPDLGDDPDNFPLRGEYPLAAEEAASMSVPVEDFRFRNALATAYKEIFGSDLNSEDDMDDFDEALNEEICSDDFGGTRIGGFPFFAQQDPRGFHERYPGWKYAGCTVLLFQSDSENCDDGGEDDYISWGDWGVANFLISPEDLAKRDFSHVMYNWSCG